jgi:hypothetical protein
MQEGFSHIPAEAAWDFLGIVAPFSAQKLSAIFQGLFFFFYCVDNLIFIQNILAPLDSDYNSSWKKTCRLSSKALHALLQFHTWFTQL